MDYLQATTPSGFLHASSCDWGDGDGERFRACMEAQGFTVTRYSPEERRRLYAAPNIGQRTPDIGGHSSATNLPDIGAEIVTPVLGRCTVSHYLTWPDGTRTAVARGPRGEGLVREWEAAPVIAQPPVIPASEPVAAPLPGGWYMPSLFDLRTA